MLPDVVGKRVVDLGCGFGWASRCCLKADTADAGISYCIADLDSLELPAGSFDLAYSALTFHYVQDFSRLTRVIRKALIAGGHLIFTIEHPIFMAAANPHWISDEEDRKTWPVNGYSLEGERRTDWFAKSVLKYHRTLGTTLNTLIDGGFQIIRVKEFAPTSEQIQQMPQLAEELERPMMLLVSASV